MSKSILLIGGTGAIGQAVLNLFTAKKEFNVYVTSRSAHTDYSNVHFLRGNAKDFDFIKSLMSSAFDVVIDFMNYSYDEFMGEGRYRFLLNSCKHYVFLSSARVYANSDKPITEISPRLLETINDEEFLKTQRYALRKARQEDLLNNSGVSNYTIIRPYKSYNVERLQLGCYEKEDWLYRALNGKPIVVKESILNKVTSLTYSGDVAYGIYKLICKDNVCGQTFQIATEEKILWRDVLKIYLDIIEKETNHRPQVYTYVYNNDIDRLFEGGYQTKYDVEYDRTFDSSKINDVLGVKIIYRPAEEGLKSCLDEFLSSSRNFRTINMEFNDLLDSLLFNNSNTISRLNI